MTLNIRRVAALRKEEEVFAQGDNTVNRLYLQQTTQHIVAAIDNTKRIDSI